MLPQPPNSTIQKHQGPDDIEWTLKPLILSLPQKIHLILRWLILLTIAALYLYLSLEKSRSEGWTHFLSPIFFILFLSLNPSLPLRLRFSQKISLNTARLLIVGNFFSKKKKTSFTINRGPKPQLFLPKIELFPPLFSSLFYLDPPSPYFQSTAKKAHAAYNLSLLDQFWLMRDYLSEILTLSGKPPIQIPTFSESKTIPLPPKNTYLFLGAWLVKLLKLSLCGVLTHLLYQDTFVDIIPPHRAINSPQLQQKFNQTAPQKNQNRQIHGTIWLFILANYSLRTLARPIHSIRSNSFTHITLHNNSLFLATPHNPKHTTIPLATITWIHGQKNSLTIATPNALHTIHHPFWNANSIAQELRLALNLC